ncbi:MAG: ABC transporter permease [Ferruginibacter sp.]
MNKISLIIKREYVTRVRNKTFLLSTFLLPIVMILFIFGSVFFAMSSKDTKKKIAVVNDPGYFKNNLKTDSARLSFVFVNDVDSNNFISKGYDAVLNLKNDSAAGEFVVHSKKQLGIETKGKIEDRLNRAYEESLLQRKGIHKSTLDSISKKSSNAYHLENRIFNKEGKSEEVNASRNYAVGFVSGILIYITMFIFGAMVMRGVMEEKTNRIAEVMVSSVKPFQLMMGKILGIALVGLTQLVLWIVLISVLSTIASTFLTSEMLQQAEEANKAIPVGGGGMAAASKSGELLRMLGGINWPVILSCFVFYFLGGYLFYAALFAAIGSVINEDPQEAQSLMLPITMPIIFGFIILSANLNTPDSPAMVWASMIPFTSPIVMMGRIPSGVPPLQLIASMLLLIGGFLFTTWLAGKIYRTGILMYGKKASWKEMFKWAFRKS